MRRKAFQYMHDQGRIKRPAIVAVLARMSTPPALPTQGNHSVLGRLFMRSLRKRQEIDHGTEDNIPLNV